jgi:hypothetical protein
VVALQSVLRVGRCGITLHFASIILPDPSVADGVRDWVIYQIKIRNARCVAAAAACCLGFQLFRVQVSRLCVHAAIFHGLVESRVKERIMSCFVHIAAELGANIREVVCMHAW